MDAVKGVLKKVGHTVSEYWKPSSPEENRVRKVSARDVDKWTGKTKTKSVKGKKS